MNHEELIHRVFTHEELRLVNSQPILVALSGGADSVALVHLLHEVGADCRAAHCNFHLRGEESMRDERFVKDLCNRMSIPLSVKDFDVISYQQIHGGSLEMACRELRYSWFEQERERQSCQLIAVAHHADDQVETFFLNLMRGTGLRGLKGMERVNGHVWRPLLGINRQDILNYLANIGQRYMTDSTNAQNDFRRNQLRNIILPIIDRQFPQARGSILDTMDNLARDHSLLTTAVCDLLPDSRHISIDELCEHPQASTLLYHRIRHMGFNRSQCVQAIEAAQQRHSGRQFIAKGSRLLVNRNTLDIEENKDNQDIEIPIDLFSDVVSPIHITISHNNAPFSPNMCDGKRKVAFSTQLLDCQHIVLRHWRKGDRMRPFGLNGSKLISDIFADLKFTHADKHNTWLMEAEGQIIWIVGFKASSLYSVNPESQHYLLLNMI